MNTAAQCGRVEALFPWYLNATASVDDRRLVEQHVASCPGCAQRLAAEESLMQQMRAEPVTAVPDADAAWQRFERTLVDAAPATTPRSAPRYMRALVVAQAAALACLAIALVYLLSERARSIPQFHTVTTNSALPSGAQFLLRIAAPGITLEQMNALALAQGAVVRSGPTPQGVFTLELQPQRMQHRVLDELRATPGILLVEEVATAAVEH